MKYCIDFVKKEVVLCVSGLLAIISAFVVIPSREYIDYIDVRVLAILFCLMLVMAGLQREGIFSKIATMLLLKTNNTRQLAFILIALCFISSMIITNDVALITFIPFSILVFEEANKREHIIYVVVLQTIAANLGSMFTPIGNPQNLYLYGISEMGMGQFLLHMLPLTIVSAVLLIVCIFFVKKEEIATEGIGVKFETNMVKVIIYCCMFVICLLTVARVINYVMVFWICTVLMLITERKIFKNVDYSLLLTFVNFFIFIGNMGNIEIVRQGLQIIVNGRELVVGILSSQVISNVPAAILLAEFTSDYKMLIWGVNIGGLGTLIASMASLISYKFYATSEGSNTGKYVKVFTGMNVMFLVILLGVALVIR